jgi:hypothetical protein
MAETKLTARSQAERCRFITEKEERCKLSIQEGQEKFCHVHQRGLKGKKELEPPVEIEPSEKKSKARPKKELAPEKTKPKKEELRDIKIKDLKIKKIKPKTDD